MSKIEEINKELEKISVKQHDLFEEQEKLEKEKRTLISKEIIDSKVLTKTKWSIECYSSYKDSSDDEFTLKAVSKEELYCLHEKLRLWHHDDFAISEDVHFISDDGDSLIHVNSLVAGIGFIKLAGIEIDTTDTDEEILSLRKKADSIQKFIDEIRTMIKKE